MLSAPQASCRPGIHTKPLSGLAATLQRIRHAPASRLLLPCWRLPTPGRPGRHQRRRLGRALSARAANAPPMLLSPLLRPARAPAPRLGAPSQYGGRCLAASAPRVAGRGALRPGLCRWAPAPRARRQPQPLRARMGPAFQESDEEEYDDEFAYDDESDEEGVDFYDEEGLGGEEDLEEEADEEDLVSAGALAAGEAHLAVMPVGARAGGWERLIDPSHAWSDAPVRRCNTSLGHMLPIGALAVTACV